LTQLEKKEEKVDDTQLQFSDILTRKQVEKMSMTIPEEDAPLCDLNQTNSYIIPNLYNVWLPGANFPLVMEFKVSFQSYNGLLTRVISFRDYTADMKVV
jgi:hypothetical protein